jgi:hypothetical protein
MIFDDWMAEDPVSSEPFSGKFPVTGNNTANSRDQPEQLPFNALQNANSRAIVQSLRPYAMGNRTGNSNRHNRDSIGQITDDRLDKSSKISTKEFNHE